MQMNIGLMIGKERTKRNMTKPKLAKLVGCTTRAIEYWESGKRNISLKHLDKILKVFNISMKIGHESDLE
jgi:Predicted transcriptional regulators